MAEQKAAYRQGGCLPNARFGPLSARNNYRFEGAGCPNGSAVQNQPGQLNRIHNPAVLIDAHIAGSDLIN